MSIAAIIIEVLLWMPVNWGFFGHRKINQLAVYTLPAEMAVFYKRHIDYLSEQATVPDSRRYIVEWEAPRHYIDLDAYPDTLRYALPKYLQHAKEQFAEDWLLDHGIVPWHIYVEYTKLQQAFMVQDTERILKISAEIGHYIADAHVPLHTTENYNGQLSNQYGIHAFWESRLPELFFSDYDFYVGKATYIQDVQQTAWETVYASHALVDSVLTLERQLYSERGSEKFSFEEKGKQTIRVVSKPYAKRYHELMSGMVERRMRNAVKMVGDIWYSAWVESGQPDLKKMLDHIPSFEEIESRKRTLLELKRDTTKRVRHHEVEY